jgi:hypothetical protein
MVTSCSRFAEREAEVADISSITAKKSKIG